MTLDALATMIAQLKEEGLPGNTPIVAFDEDSRLRSFDINLEPVCRDEKDKMASGDEVCIMAFGVTV